MTGTPQPPWPAPAPSRWTAGRIVALVLGICLLLPGLGLLAGGGALLWADHGSRTAGFLTSPADSFATPGYALASDRVDLATGTDWLPMSVALGKVQVTVSATGGSAVFVGIAPVPAATAYLDGVQHTVIKDLGLDASNTGVLVAGGAPAGPPGEQDFWVSQASGTGSQRLSWTPAEGNWMLVVMNADGSANVAVRASIGATVPSLAGIAWSVLGMGLVLSVIGIVLIVLASRRRAGSSGMPPGGWAVPTPRPGETPSSWAPPVPQDRASG